MSGSWVQHFGLGKLGLTLWVGEIGFNPLGWGNWVQHFGLGKLGSTLWVGEIVNPFSLERKGIFQGILRQMMNELSLIWVEMCSPTKYLRIHVAS